VTPPSGYFVHPVVSVPTSQRAPKLVKVDGFAPSPMQQLDWRSKQCNESVENPWTVGNAGRDGSDVALSLCVEI
jgi:hypothetical protein